MAVVAVLMAVEFDEDTVVPLPPETVVGVFEVLPLLQAPANDRATTDTAIEANFLGFMELLLGVMVLPPQYCQQS